MHDLRELRLQDFGTRGYDDKEATSTGEDACSRNKWNQQPPFPHWKTHFGGDAPQIGSNNFID